MIEEHYGLYGDFKIRIEYIKKRLKYSKILHHSNSYNKKKLLTFRSDPENWCLSKNQH